MAPVGRPRTFDMEAVLEAAMLLFWEQGYEATSLAQLRETTGLSSASLYGAFSSKEGLFEKAVEHYIAGPGSVTDVVADEAVSPREAVARLLHGSIDMQTDTSHPRGCLVALSGTVRAAGAGEAGAEGAGTEEAGAGETGVRKVVAARRAADRARIRACVVRGIASGELAEDTDVDGVTSMIHGFLLGISTQVCDGTPARHLHAAADAVLANWNAQGR
ncbi:AcrR family transcriptional regulator [Streptomyces aurantiacus]|uniref:TetR/AcrR family transcriptional regulator n=1 Tax=Streptomyces aurantiacus TaxID=47760 RepID=UPI00278C959B|nr:TetR/AcrR family transcriptional regulator [Streptomyces aurantiacus]MDQ0776280.1 AcrR family transcriptional regulator [Streptomyces aurantiacus]